jgi:two-component system, OmpR family, phosphate regulon sensor histidine kinase PhoR
MKLFRPNTYSRQLAATLVSVVALVLVVGVLLLSRVIRTQLIQDLTQELFFYAELLRADIGASSDRFPTVSSLHAIIKKYEKVSKTRWSVIDHNGVVVDSHIPSDQLNHLENYRTRPEIAAAFRGEPGQAIRFSDTIKEDMLVVALPLYMQGKLVGAVCLSMPLLQVRQKINLVRTTMVWIMLAVLLVTMIFVLWFSHSLTKPIVDIFEALYELANEKYAARLRWFTSDAHNQFGTAFNRLAEKVQSTVQELAQERAHFDAILSTMVEAVLAVDVQGKVIHVNPALKKLFDLTDNSEPGRHYLEIIRHSEIDHMLKSVLQTQESRSGEVRLFFGEEKILEIHVEPLRQSGQFIGALLVMYDITRLRRLEQMRREFVANVSHELRTPLSSIKGFAETLQMGGLEDKKHRADFVASIESQTDRMIKLVDDLLDLSTIESGQRKPTRVPLSLRDVAVSVQQELKMAAAKKNISVQVTIEDRLPLISADADQLRQVFFNLLDNALKYTPHQGTITLGALMDGPSVRVFIQDTGPGIPSEDIPRIFERFYRVDKARSRDLGGTGLGLAIVKHIVEAHGGTVAVESRVGVGSTFFFILPL